MVKFSLTPPFKVRRPLQAEPSAVRGAGGGNHVRRRLGPRPRRRGGGRGAVQVRYKHRTDRDNRATNVEEGIIDKIYFDL